MKILASGYSGDIDAIDKGKAEKIVTYTKEKMAEAENRKYASDGGGQQTSSLADELAKLAKLKADGIISDAEFQQMKQDLIKKSG